MAVIWQVLLFEQKYIEFGYLDGDPTFLVGLASVAAQAAVLSYLYAYVGFSGSAIIRGLKFTLLLGLFL